jgi:hypothetical protein
MPKLRSVLVLASLMVAQLASAQTIQQLSPPAAQAQRPADGTDADKPPTAIVRGHVLAADTGQPLRRAQVRLLSMDVEAGGKRENRQATTDTAGAYEFKELLGGRYQVSASKGSYVTMSTGQTRPNDLGKPITLRNGELLERVDFALPRGGVVTGRVVDEYGDPISNVQVGAMRSQTIGGRKQLMPTGRISSTNDLGEFRVFGIPPGQYAIQATWHGMMPVLAPGARADDESGYATTFFPGTVAASEAQRLTVASGQTISDVVFAMVTAKVARLSGTVVDSHGRPAQGMLMISRNESGNSAMGGINMGAPIRPDGTFAFANLTAGDYTLQATLVGPKPETAVAKVAVAGVDITDVRLTALPPSSATGRIVVDPAALQSLASATLSVFAIAMNQAMFDRRTPARVADDLTFTLDAPPGLMRIAVFGQPPGFDVRAVRVSGVDVTDSGVEFKAGRDLSGLEIELTNKLTTVSGLVSDSRGETAKEYSVVVFPQDQSRLTPGSRYVKTGRPDQDGRFKVAGLPPGEYYAIALDRIENVSWNDPEFLQSVQPQATTFSLMEAETKTLDLKLRAATR